MAPSWSGSRARITPPRLLDRATAHCDYAVSADAAAQPYALPARSSCVGSAGRGRWSGLVRSRSKTRVTELPATSSSSGETSSVYGEALQAVAGVNAQDLSSAPRVL